MYNTVFLALEKAMTLVDKYVMDQVVTLPEMYRLPSQKDKEDRCISPPIGGGVIPLSSCIIQKDF